MKSVTRTLMDLMVAGALALACAGAAAALQPAPAAPQACGDTCNATMPCGSGCGHCNAGAGPSGQCVANGN